MLFHVMSSHLTVFNKMQTSLIEHSKPDMVYSSFQFPAISADVFFFFLICWQSLYSEEV